MTGRRLVKRKKLIKRFGNISGVYESVRGIQFFAWYIPIPGPGYFDNPEANKLAVDIRTMRLRTLRGCTIAATEACEKGALTAEELEIVLDYLFAELNHRLNKKTKGLD